MRNAMSRRSLAWWSTRSLPVLAIALLAACGTSGGDATPPPGTTPDADGGTLPDGAPIVTPPGPDASTDAEAGPRDYVDMKISASATDALNPTQNPLVISQSTQVDSGGTTSLRFSSTKPIDDNMFPVGAPNNNQVADPSQRKVEQRDRDLGQARTT